jgi:hypothetical protein
VVAEEEEEEEVIGATAATAATVAATVAVTAGAIAAGNRSVASRGSKHLRSVGAYFSSPLAEFFLRSLCRGMILPNPPSIPNAVNAVRE